MSGNVGGGGLSDETVTRKTTTTTGSSQPATREQSGNGQEPAKEVRQQPGRSGSSKGTAKKQPGSSQGAASGAAKEQPGRPGAAKEPSYIPSTAYLQLIYSLSTVYPTAYLQHILVFQMKTSNTLRNIEFIY